MQLTAAPTESHLASVWFRVTDLDVVRGEGSWVVTPGGERYLDLTSGIAVTSTGHCHPRVVAAITEQAGRFVHAQANVYRHDLLDRLASRLAGITPSSIESFFFANSGAEATEAAVKLVKQATGRPNVIVFEGSFHGRTHLTMAMTTSKSAYRAGYQPLPSGVFVAPFPDLVGRLDDAVDTEVDRCLDGLRSLLRTQTGPAETAGVILEPVLGEGGYVPAPPRFLRGVVEICRLNDILFLADEVQTGFGRTGALFAVEHYGVEPDVLIMAKGIASGFPLSAVGARSEIMARWPVGSHGGTYGGNPIGCAAALATIDILTEPGFLDLVNARGRQLLEGLHHVSAGDPGVADIRGLGLMIATQFFDSARAQAIQAHLLREHRVIVMTAGAAGDVIRWMPPLVVTTEEVDLALNAFAAALRAGG